MNTPYSSSGASSRAHYALVRRVEEARSQKDAETYLRDEEQLMRRRFALSPMSTSDIRVSLIILLYCLTTSHGSVTRTSLEFAIPSAIHLVEAGSTSTEKRVGYLFCNEVMPKDHGMRLMLINSIRKDLESRRVTRMSLALSCIIAVPFAEVVPAVIDLILKATSNSSPRIKALAIKTLIVLSSVDPDILTQERVAKAIEPRLHDGEEMVAKAALEACIGLSNTFPTLNRPMVDHCIGVLRQFSRGKAYSNYSSGYIQKICQTLGVSLDEQSRSTTEVLEMALRTLKIAIKRNNYALGLESIRLISKVPTDISVAYFAPHDEVPTSKKLHHPIDSIKHLLGSQSLNDHYVFLSYLSILPVQLWAGPPEVDGGVQQTGPTHLPLALSQWEVERIITFMDSSDEQIRRLTLSILTHVSSSLVEKSYEGRLSHLSSSSSTSRAVGGFCGRLLEMADALCSVIEDEGARGRSSASKYSEVCELCKGETVSHEILEHTVHTLRKGKQPIGPPFVSNWTLAVMQGKTEGNVLVTPSNLLEDQSSSVDSAPFFIDPNTPASSKSQARALNWTLMLVFATFVCEHANLLHRDDLREVITWLASCLEFYPPTMQEPMILCVIRLIALLESPSEIDASAVEAIKSCSTNSASKLFKKYCDAFLSYSNDLDRLKALIDSDATLSQIPEVVTKLEATPTDTTAQTSKALHVPQTPSKPPTSNTTPLTPSALAQSQLRYAAYDRPEANANPRVNSFSTLSTSSRRSEASSRHGRASDEHVDLTKTITAGDLALAGASNDGLLSSMSRIAVKPKLAKGKRGVKDIEKEESVKKVDLISLDSPFLSEPIQRAVSSSSHGEGSGATSYASLPETNFDVIWAECEASGNSTRGWLDAPLDNAVLRLQGIGIHIDVISLDDAPFQGELKVLLKADPPESEDSDSIAKVAAVRLRDGEEGSCLWQMRSSDHALLVLVKQALCE